MPAASGRRPNILVIVVDQLRFPQWFGTGPGGPSLPPNLRRLRHGAVSFARHYTASNDCSPSRSALLTGLYTHQTGCMITGGSTLDPGFPTWGTMLREHGYHTSWYGKWHLTHHDNKWNTTGQRTLEEYGFAGGTYPSPDGAPGQGWRVDPQIAGQFEDWFAGTSDKEPWCTTVSFVNPHDIAWWYKWSDRVPAEASARRRVQRLPPNYETPELLLERRKPRLQRSFQETAAASFGPVPFSGPEATEKWLEFLDLYVKIQLQVDRHIGQVMRTLESRPEVAANTVILFTSDHGEYGASHGMRGKGASAYEECIRVPLLVKDPRGILANPSAPGREFVLHATDETVTEFAIEPYAADAPLHVVALRTPQAKYATYSNWPYDGIAPKAQGEEVELYDYSTSNGRLELHNSAGESPLEEGLRAEYKRAFADELRAPLPRRLVAAHARGFADYFSTARHDAVSAAARRKRRSEREAQRPHEFPPSTPFRHPRNGPISS